MTITHWMTAYNQQDPLTMLTAYDATMARLISNCNIDAILVGDSLRHTFFGDSTTIHATVDHMIYHTQAVSNGITSGFIVTDMPYGSMHPDQALTNAKKMVTDGGAHAIKCEPKPTDLDSIRKIVDSGIPVMAHIGLQPQLTQRDYSLRGTTTDEANKLLAFAKQLSDCNVIGIILEKIPMGLAKTITESVNCPTIGIGAGPYCSGQILVSNDILGLTPNFNPKFLRKYFDGTTAIQSAIQQYKHDVKNKTFPTESESYIQ